MLGAEPHCATHTGIRGGTGRPCCHDHLVCIAWLGCTQFGGSTISGSRKRPCGLHVLFTKPSSGSGCSNIKQAFVITSMACISMMSAQMKTDAKLSAVRILLCLTCPYVPGLSSCLPVQQAELLCNSECHQLGSSSMK